MAAEESPPWEGRTPSDGPEEAPRSKGCGNDAKSALAANVLYDRDRSARRIGDWPRLGTNLVRGVLYSYSQWGHVHRDHP